MAELKTKVNEASVEGFLNKVESEKKRTDAFKVLEMMKRITGEKPKMWGPSIIGFGSYHYKYESGREGDWFVAGFSPRKQSLVLYIMSGFKRYGDLMSKLGKHKTGKGCLYINKLEDIDQSVLEELITESVNWLRENEKKQS